MASAGFIRHWHKKGNVNEGGRASDPLGRERRSNRDGGGDYDDAEPRDLEQPALPQHRQGRGASDGVAVHKKSSAVKDHHPPAPSTASKPPHLSQKHPEEKDAANPDELPDYTWETRRPTASPTARARPASTPTPTLMPTLLPTTLMPTVDIRRVNPAPDFDDDDDVRPKCRAADGAYFGDGQSSRNGGVLLRYQYELVQGLHAPSSDVGGGDGIARLVRDILPGLEREISDALIPVFFEECSNAARGDSRSDREGGRTLRRGARMGTGPQTSRRRRLNDVVGIDSRPDDFPLTDIACECDPPDPLRSATTQCHLIEGVLTLHFPPNRPLSALLSSVALTALRAIEAAMDEGSLERSHGDIRSLCFLQSSYDLRPVVPVENGGLRQAGPRQIQQGAPEEGGPDGDFFLGFVLGTAIPLAMLVCFCCYIGTVKWRCWRGRQPGDGGDSSAQSVPIDDSLSESVLSHLDELT